MLFLRRRGWFLVIALGALTPAVACDSSSTGTTSDAGLLPPNPGGPPPDGTGSTVLAISKLDFGDATQDAWRSIGLDIDGKSTTNSSTDVCTPAPGAGTYGQADGTNGIDNSFGQNLVPILASFYGSIFSQNANDALRAGDATMLIRIDQLGSGQSYSPMSGAAFRATSVVDPKWDGADARDIDTASLVSGDLARPLAMFTDGYMNQRSWVGVPPAESALFDLHVSQEGHFPAPFPITHVRVVMQIDPSNGSASQGVLSGIVAPDDAIAWFEQLAGWGSNTFCSASAVEDVVDVIRQAADVMIDGSNGPGQECNGISFGIGFDATAVSLGKVVTAPPPAPPDPCPDAGTRSHP